eukprot:12123358-Alexandrium_andersonii.AAC.1
MEVWRLRWPAGCRRLFTPVLEDGYFTQSAWGNAVMSTWMPPALFKQSAGLVGAARAWTREKEFRWMIEVSGSW